MNQNDRNQNDRDRQDIAERQYQQGRQYHNSRDGERSEELLSALDCYETALQYYTFDTFPAKWETIQQEVIAASRELVELRRNQTKTPLSSSQRSRRSKLTWAQRLVFVVIFLTVLAFPTTALVKAALAQGGPSCASGALNIDGSTVLQSFVQDVADDYMHHCPNAQITVGGGASKTGLADVEQGHDVIAGIQKDPWHVGKQDVPIEIADSDIFASPTQQDLVDHQIAIGVFVVILNKEVTGLHNLSIDQLRGIYTGVYQNWNEICDQGQCGPNLPIIPISRSTNSGTRFTFEKYVLNAVATVPGLGLERTIGIPPAVQEVEQNPGSISYTDLSRASKASDITIVTIEGNDPHNSLIIQNNKYPLWNIEHMYTRGQGSPLAQAFINYMYSDVAQKLLSKYALLRLTDVPLDIRQQRT
jgi:phosphate transport system substrate-binding protein